ncbi:MAG: hypothetical protein IPP22_15055 [Nitrosomonas sp.]|nr:hypothetical protein [Nitrosomonas sp.]
MAQPYARQQQARPKDNKTLHIRKTARPEPWQAIYQALDLISKIPEEYAIHHSCLESNLARKATGIVCKRD